MSPFHVKTYAENQAEHLANQAGQQQLELGEQARQSNALKLQSAQQDMADAETVRQHVQQYGDLEKALPALAGRVQPRTLQGLQTYLTDYRGKLSEIGKRDADARKAIEDVDQQEADVVGHAMLAVRQAGYTPAMLDMALSDMAQYPRYKDEVAQIRGLLGQKPETLREIVDQLVSRSPKAMEQARLLDQQAQTGRRNRDLAEQAAATAEETRRHNEAMEAPKPTAEEQDFQAYLQRYYAANNIQPSRAAEFKAYQEWQAQKRARVPVPGVDVPFSAEVEGQRRRISESGRANTETGNNIRDTAQGIVDGTIPPPDVGSRPTQYSLALTGELKRLGYNLSVARRDWIAIQKHLNTLNGAQQGRLRQAVSFTYDSLDMLEQLFDDWKRAGMVTGIKLFNKASLATAKNLPGKAGAAAQALESQIADLTSELGTVYKGGNSSTDESLKLAAENLRADWNEETFKRNVKLVRQNLQIRKNSIMSSKPVGVSADSPYLPGAAGGGRGGRGGGAEQQPTHRFNPATGRIEVVK